MTTAEYFEQRALHKEHRMKNLSDKYLKELEKQYRAAEKEIEKKVQKFQERYLSETDGSIQDLRKALNTKELSEYYQEINEYLKNHVPDEKLRKQLQKKYLQGQYYRYQALQKQIELQLELLGQTTDRQTFEHLKNIYRQAYYESAHELYENRYLGLNSLSQFLKLSMTSLDESTVERIVKNPWSSKSFSERIWKNNRKLRRAVRDTLSQGFIQGENIDKMSRRLKNKMKSGMNDARRLVRTESNYLLGEATQVSYENAGLELYKFLATLDYKTSEICRELDGKIFKVSKRKVGINCNPMHPNCRSTTRAYFPEYEAEDVDGTRIARGADGKQYYVNRNMNYKQWFESLSKEEQHQMELLRTMDKNKSADKKQFIKYKKVLQEDIPRKFENFIQMKYNESKDWELIKTDYRRRTRLIHDPDLALPNMAFATIDNRKFTEYLFGGSIEDGLQKGRLITKRLGYDIKNYEEFKRDIIKRMKINLAKYKDTIKQGDRYEQNIIFYNKNGKPTNTVIGWLVKDKKVHMSSIYIREVKKNEDTGI